MRPLQDLTGKRFGKLTVIRRYGTDRYKRVIWLCRCDCGNETIAAGTPLKNGHKKSCGCYKYEATFIHGFANKGNRLYNIWDKMNYRCVNVNYHRYKDYGGRGIKVCNEWKNSFVIFRDWALSNGYADNLTLDRIDVNGNYEPSNCRWITNAEQQKNKRNSKKK